VLVYGFAGCRFNGFSVFHATPTPAQPDVPGRLEIRQRRYRREGRIRAAPTKAAWETARCLRLFNQ